MRLGDFCSPTRQVCRLRTDEGTEKQQATGEDRMVAQAACGTGCQQEASQEFKPCTQEFKVPSKAVPDMYAGGE